MPTRKALGRGLAALIPTPAVEDAPLPAEEIGAPLFIRIDRISANPSQPRKHFDQGELNSLAASIREQGVLQPLVVRHREDGYELIIGERRWRASQLAGLEEVPAVVLDATDRAVVEMALVENVQRADLNAVELAEAFRFLTLEEGLTQEEAGRRVGLDRSSVANYLRLLELDTEILQDLIDQRLSMGHAKAILMLPEAQRPALRIQIHRRSLSVRAAEELARSMLPDAAAARPRAGPTRDVHVVAAEDELRRALHTRVRIVGRRTKGRIEIHYAGATDLDRLIEHLIEGGK